MEYVPATTKTNSVKMAETNASKKDKTKNVTPKTSDPRSQAETHSSPSSPLSPIPDYVRDAFREAIIESTMRASNELYSKSLSESPQPGKLKTSAMKKSVSPKRKNGEDITSGKKSKTEPDSDVSSSSSEPPLYSDMTRSKRLTKSQLPVECKYCNKMFSNPFNMRQHAHKQHFAEVLKELREDSTSEPVKYAEGQMEFPHLGVRRCTIWISKN